MEAGKNYFYNTGITALLGGAEKWVEKDRECVEDF